MDSATSRAHDASDDHEAGDRTAATAALLDALAAAPPSDRALGSALLLSGDPSPQIGRAHV